jgi:hypothetical protein
MGAIAVAARLAQGKAALVDMPEDGVVHRRDLGLGLQLRRRGRRRRLLLARRLRLSAGMAASVAKLDTGAQGGHDLGAAGRLAASSPLVRPSPKVTSSALG